MWALLSEVLQRPIDEVASSTVPGSVRAVLPTALSEPDRWQLLLWAAIQCALHWYDATHRGGLEAATTRVRPSPSREPSKDGDRVASMQP